MYFYDKVLGTKEYGEWAGKPFKARNYAACSDVCLILAGTGAPFEYESFDRPDMKLPYVQERAIIDISSVNPNTVVVIFAGAAIDVSAWADKVKGIVYAGFCGERGLNALADILCGKVNPSGKLTETFPVNAESTPVYGTYLDTMVTCYEDGLNVGYRYYDRHPQAAAFEFGFGLSYSQFKYGDLKVKSDGTEADVTFTVQNLSEIAGKEVAQVYVQELSPVVYRPLKELKGFAKVEIKAGEKKRINIKLDKRSFAYYSTADDCWRVNDGAFRILVGSSSRDIRLEKVIRLENGKIV